MKKLFIIFASAISVLPVAAAFSTEASFSADAYTDNEPLSSKGVTDASWVDSDAFRSAVNTVENGTNGISFCTGSSTNGVELVAGVADTSDGEGVRRIDFSVSTATLSDGDDFPVVGAAALTPAYAADRSRCFLGWGEGVWQELAANGVEALIDQGGMVDVRIELKTVNGSRYVRYFVRMNGGWTVLATKSGRSWFPTVHETSRTRCGVAGNGRFSSITASSDPESTITNFYWIGTGSGSWIAAANWSRTPGGTAAESAPLHSEAGIISGSVDIDFGAEQATVTDAVVVFDENGVPEMISGTVGGKPVVNTDRPRVGKKLTVEAPSIFGRSADYTYKWYRATYAKSKFSWLQDGATHTPDTSDYEHWLQVIAYADGVAVSSNTFLVSKLPVCYLKTDDGKNPTSAKEEHMGTVRVQGGENYKLQYDGVMKIKVRGNTTASANKKPYKIKLDKKTNMFGFGKNKHWVLLANAYDKSNQRNKLAYDLANDIGVLGMDSTWVVCVLNGTYIGLYQFCEHIRPDENRVPIKDWEDIAEEPEDLHNLDMTQYDVEKDGGYILEFSTENDEVTRFNTSAKNLNMRTMVNSPEYLLTNAVMYAYVKNIMKDYWGACTAADRLVPNASGYTRRGKHYSEFCDIDSMVGYTLVNELFTNQDASQKSRYCYIKDGRIVWGPVWDFDWGSGGVKVTKDGNYGVTNRWIAAKSTNHNSMIAEWSADFLFCKKIHAAYWANRARFERIIQPGGDLDQNIEYVREAALANDQKWGTADRKWATDNEIFRQNMAGRLDWMDKQFSSVTNLIESFRSSAQSSQSTWNANAASVATTDAKGRSVPSVPLEWVRDASVGADASYAWASESRLRTAVSAEPSVWGKTTPLWMDYVLGTNPDPSAPDSVFKITSCSFVDGAPSLTWSPDLGTARTYRILGTSSLSSPWHAPLPADHFFKVDVSLP